MEKLKIDDRRKKILQLLARDGKVRIAQLSKELHTTVVTIRNDLTVLERDGYCERISGGAIQTVKNFYDMNFQQRKLENMEDKKAIASAVTDLVADGETLFLNSGTTTYYVAIELKKHKSLSIVTNSLSIAIELGSIPSFRVILLGGEINSQYAFTYGHEATNQLRKYKAEKVILSVDGISYKNGLSTLNAEEAEINKVMIERARQTIIVADRTKLGHESFFNFGELSDKCICVTNYGADEEQLRNLEAAGVEIICCSSLTD